MSTIELTARIRELRELQALIEEANAEAENIKDVIKAHMGDSEELRAGTKSKNCMIIDFPLALDNMGEVAALPAEREVTV
ncbi:MAG: hypothetical protein FWG32_06065 [Oscillospiraceae bacterium]|nr:hypothetical protein [Oscillospiraceae bacterium]